jgi:hypothetical protein
MDSPTYELQQILSVLEFFVCDVCIAVTLLLRFGWLPDNQRLHCFHEMKQSLVENGWYVNTSQYFLG